MQKMQRSYQIDLAPHADAYNSRYVVIEIELDTGKKIRQRIDVPKGSPKNPYNQTEMLLKLTDAIKEQQKAMNLLTDIKELASGLTVNQFLARHYLTL